MRVTNSILLTALFLAVVRAQQAAFEGSQQPISSDKRDQKTASKSESKAEPKQPQQPQQQQQTAPQELTPEEFEMAKDGIRQILGQLPIQHVEPLVNTMEGYCSSFGALCTAACKERMTDEDAKSSTLSLGCADPKALTIGTAGASCKCASFYMTDRVNFAIVGGILSYHETKPGDFGAEGILDAIQFLPAVPTFLSIIHVLQTICHYIGFLDILTTNPYPSNCSTGGKTDGGLLGTITGLISGIGNIIPGLGGILGGLLGTGGGGNATPPPIPSTGGSLGDFLGGLFGGSKPTPTPTLTPTPTPTPSTGGSVWDFLGGLFGGSKPTTRPKPTPTLTPTITLKPTSTLAPTTTTTTLTSTTTTPPSSGGFFGWLGGLFGERANTDRCHGRCGVSLCDSKKLFGFFSETDEDDGDDEIEESEDVEDASRLISNDGRVARIVRAQKRLGLNKDSVADDGDRIKLSNLALLYDEQSNTISLNAEGSTDNELDVISDHVLYDHAVNIAKVAPFIPRRFKGRFSFQETFPAPALLPAQLPNQLFSLPAVEALASIQLYDTYGSPILCTSVLLTNTVSAQSPVITIASVSLTVASVALAATTGLLALLSSAAVLTTMPLAATGGTGGTGTVGSSAGLSPSGADVVSFCQFIAMSGSLNIEYPELLQQWTQNFGWSMGLVQTDGWNDAINSLRTRTSRTETAVASTVKAKTGKTKADKMLLEGPVLLSILVEQAVHNQMQSRATSMAMANVDLSHLLNSAYSKRQTPSTARAAPVPATAVPVTASSPVDASLMNRFHDYLSSKDVFDSSNIAAAPVTSSAPALAPPESWPQGGNHPSTNALGPPGLVSYG
ncbi:hypothetical protein BGX33_011410 [Mortierella sp. NVP41]|nr:hypothetical protein BGX33_011410 [Mortierella sp. NVP41]